MIHSARWLLSFSLILGVCGGSALGQTNAVRFQFSEPHHRAYRLETPVRALRSVTHTEWLKAVADDGSTNRVELGSRVVLQLHPPAQLTDVLRGRTLQLARTITTNLFVLQAPDAWTALREAEQLAALPEVAASAPVMRRSRSKHGVYAPAPNDAYFPYQWHLENRDTNGTPLGPDLNVRAAWPFTRGAGVLIAQADDGIELAHPDLVNQLLLPLSYDFFNVTNGGGHLASDDKHGTCVAGLIAAQGNNNRGVIGVAPEARLASWVIFGPGSSTASDEQFANMFQSASNSISVQNHSWGNAGTTPLGPSLLEQVAISNAVALGRNGLGVVMARAGGNERETLNNANDDGYSSDPRVITVAAVADDGRAAYYSNPGACLLVSAPSGGAAGQRTLFTTDRLGTQGYNFANYTNDLADYAFDGSGFSGTSGATPQISGVCALILAANSNLTVRDVQQILIFSSRQFDPADPDLTTNGAGLLVSHNTGFGIPDAGQAVALAQRWVNRPAQMRLTFSATNTLAIPDQGLRLSVAGTPPTNLRSAICVPGIGPHVDSATPFLLVEDVGQVIAPITNNLTGKAALIQRGGAYFYEKINYAAQAGAALAIIYNNPGGNTLALMAGTDFTPIPAVFLNQADGEALKNFRLANGSASVQVSLNSAVYSFTVTNTLSCEHVGVRVRTDHSQRSDVRITLTSPSGTRSVLQQLNEDNTPGPVDWTYYSTHHFFEATAGVWTVAVSDEGTSGTGSVLGVDLTLFGVPITDTDNDGLDDNWELAHFGNLSSGPQADPDGDGYNNLREFIMGTDPNVVDELFQLTPDLSVWDARLARLSWPSVTNRTYEIRVATGANAPFTTLTNIAGRFPETEFFLPYTNAVNQFFRVRSSLVP